MIFLATKERSASILAPLSNTLRALLPSETTRLIVEGTPPTDGQEAFGYPI